MRRTAVPLKVTDVMPTVIQLKRCEAVQTWRELLIKFKETFFFQNMAKNQKLESYKMKTKLQAKWGEQKSKNYEKL